MLSTASIRLCLVIWLFACVPAVVWAQVGRTFVSVEAFVGLARVVHVGKIVELEAIEYDQPLTDTQKIGKPYRLVFAVSETIRGEEVERLELVLSLQSVHELHYLREQGAEVMLVGGPNTLRTLPRPEIGIAEQGKRVDGEWYQFRLLEPLAIPEPGESEFGDPAEIAKQLNRSHDACRMFTSDLEIVEGRREILQRARAFAKEHSKLLSGVSLRVPNDFGALVGSPNAYCHIILPICPATRQTLTDLKADPSPILRRMKSRDDEFWLSHVRPEIDKALAKFEEDDGEE